MRIQTNGPGPASPGLRAKPQSTPQQYHRPGHPGNPLHEAKRRLPLPQLMDRLGDGDHARRRARCPFHDDSAPSFSVFQGRNGVWLWKCHAGCGHGDGVDYLAKRVGLSTRDAIRRYCELAGVRQTKGGA